MTKVTYCVGKVDGNGSLKNGMNCYGATRRDESKYFVGYLDNKVWRGSFNSYAGNSKDGSLSRLSGEIRAAYIVATVQ
ncbi:hypothetical protein TNCV_450861 [Trichonephila clavipes]|nr:hypothetical protein TNCV_450861 [Trichonephila clavipes]